MHLFTSQSVVRESDHLGKLGKIIFIENVRETSLKQNVGTFSNVVSVENR